MITPTGTASADVAELLRQVHEVEPVLKREVEAGEQACRLTDVAVEAMADKGLLRLLAPRELGGHDLGPSDVLRVTAALFEVEASAAWVAMVLNSQLRGLQFLDVDVVRRVLYAAGVPRIAGSGAPTGKAELVDGGYCVSGKWSYGSGIHHADFVNSCAVVTVDGQPVMSRGQPKTIMFLTDAAAVHLRDNWNVLGLRATGSIDYEIADVFVPEELARDASPTATMSWGGASARLPLAGWLTVLHTAVDIGMGRSLLSSLKTIARLPARAGQSMADRSGFRYEFARCRAAFDSASSWITDIWAGIDEEIGSGRSPSLRQLTNARAAMMHIHEVNVANATFTFHECGGIALRSGNIQRLVRDIMAAGQHVFVSRRIYEDCGREMLDQAEGMRWTMLGLA
jgi:alkylation response protein AidB-like acyl-CoA dehydrogenase